MSTLIGRYASLNADLDLLPAVIAIAGKTEGRRIVKTAKVIGGGGVMSAARLAPGVPASAQTPPPPTGPRDDLDTQVSAVGEAQCGKPVSRRTGNWMCFVPATRQAQGLRAALAGRPAADLQRRDGHCTAKGCWDVYSSIDSDFY